MIRAALVLWCLSLAPTVAPASRDAVEACIRSGEISGPEDVAAAVEECTAPGYAERMRDNW